MSRKELTGPTILLLFYVFHYKSSGILCNQRYLLEDANAPLRILIFRICLYVVHCPGHTHIHISFPVDDVLEYLHVLMRTILITHVVYKAIQNPGNFRTIYKTNLTRVLKRKLKTCFCFSSSGLRIDPLIL